MQKARRGTCISIEGLDKCGKGTVLKGLVGVYKHQNLQLPSEVVFTAEPYEDCLMGRELRKVLTHEIPAPNAYELQRMFVINRAVHQQCVVRPALAAGKIVIMDRGPWSTIAYGAGQTYQYPSSPTHFILSALNIIELHKTIIGPEMVWQDLTVYLDITAETAMERSQRDPGNPQYFEKLTVLERVRTNYLELTRNDTVHAVNIGESVTINGSLSPNIVLTDVTNAIMHHLASH